MSAAPYVLALDTSTPRCTLALGRLDTATLVASNDVIARGREASAALADRMSALFDDAGVAPRSLCAVACGVGPGMFTGVRVALATAKGVALGLGIPGIGVSTLASIAALPTDTAPRLAVIDARRGEVYAAVYEADGTASIPDLCAPLDDVLARLTRPVVAVGSGVQAYREPLEQHPQVLRVQDEPGPTADSLWRATLARREHQVDAETLAAVYLRQSYAELGIHKPKRPFVKSPFVD